ncbi:hypothetical protein OUZ56_012780 [Daphnia magna]|uniref:Uncharacterized protein n=1 Tax=Daphnia magna TaxID=35525 RepID=A0ABQ9Z415_9CRUS|nr:hypothetical protein OUZ56_012780 [Daphnia magna]
MVGSSGGCVTRDVGEMNWRSHACRMEILLHKDGASILERTKRDRKNSLLKPSSHLFCCMQRKWHTNYLCPSEEELEELYCLSLGIKSIKYYKEWSSKVLSSELEKIFQELSICEGYCLCMKSGKFLKLVQSTVPDCKSLKGIFPKMIYLIPMQSNLIGRPDPNVKISTIQCKECGKLVNRVHFLTHLADLCYDETPLKDGIKYGRPVVSDETKSLSPIIDGNEISNGDGEVEIVTPKTNLRRHGSQLSLPTSDTGDVNASHVEEALVTKRNLSPEGKNNHHWENMHSESQKRLSPEKKQSTDCVIEEYIAEREYSSLEEVQSYLTVSSGEMVTEMVFQDINKTLSPTSGNVTVNGRHKCTDPIIPLPLPILTVAMV